MHKYASLQRDHLRHARVFLYLLSINTLLIGDDLDAGGAFTLTGPGSYGDWCASQDSRPIVGLPVDLAVFQSCDLAAYLLDVE